ncbi:MAG: OmpA family protein [Alphaproteobacteria bacterium]|nr:OmpA family protein [Alphaproteobacteria bacterium]
MRNQLNQSWRARILCAALLCAWGAPSAEAQMRRPTKPSVEVNFEVLKELEAAARGTSFAAPVQGRDSISATALPPVGYSAPTTNTGPSQRVTASGRKIPEEQPMQPEENMVAQRKPVNAPFGASSGPAPRLEPVVAKAPKPKPKPAAKPVETAKAEPPKPAAPAEKPVAAPPPPVAAEPPKPMDEKKLMEALEKEAPKPTETAKTEAPALPEIPDFKAAPGIPELKSDLALPEPPKQEAQQLPPALPEPAPAPDVLVVKKDAVELPPIELPAVGAAPDEKPLLPSLEKRMDTLFAKQPEKEGVIGDKTTIIDPTVDSKMKADEAAAQLADQQEAARRAQLEEKQRLAEAAATPMEAVLPKSTAPVKREETQIAALPEIPALENKPIAAGSNDVDLPPPALPSLTPITGGGEEKSSLDIVAPQDGVMSKDTQPPVLQPLDAPEEMPKVTKGEAEPALPPIELPAVQPKETDKDAPPPLPDFSQLKSSPEAPAKKTKVAMAPLPKPEFVKADIKKEPAKPVVEGTASAQFTFSKDATELDEASKAELTDLAKQITREDRNVRIVAYAAGTAEQASIARRISLSRALQIRAHLIDQGVNQLKINVQAMGNKEQAERADVFLK